MAQFVRLEVADGIGTIRIDRPKMNPLNSVVQEELREFARVQHVIPIRILPPEPFSQPFTMRGAGQHGAAPAWLLGRRQHAVVVAVHRVEGVAQPILVFGQRDAAVAVRVSTSSRLPAR